MGVATGLAKFLVFLFNFFFVVGGIALVVFGALFYNGYKTYETILPDLGPYQFPPILMMVVGGIVFLIAFMGCCGIIRESKCMMMTYATFLVILLIGELVIAIGIYARQDELKDLLKKGLHDSMGQYGTNQQVKEVWDTMQHNLKCCGVEKYSDWGLHVPPSCCSDSKEDCNTVVNRLAAELFKTGEIYREGCVDKMIDELKTEWGMWGAGILALAELVGIIFGCCLGARFGRKRYVT